MFFAVKNKYQSEFYKINKISEKTIDKTKIDLWFVSNIDIRLHSMLENNI